MNILDKLVAATAERLKRDKERIPFDSLVENAGKIKSPEFAFEKALAKEKGMSFICEVKKASPSKGLIAEDFPYLQTAKEYEAAGAACISVLTEPDYFLGNDRYLEEIKDVVSIPVLRKDFIIDPYQIYQAKQLGAAAVLLICAILDKKVLQKYIEICDGLGLSSLVETHDENEVKDALCAGARIIGVNNRNLKNFEVDLQTSIRLRKMIPPEIIFVSESGISTRADIEILEKNNVNAVLIGESLMRTRDKKEALDRLRGLNL